MRKHVHALAGAAALFLLMPAATLAQEEEEQPETRIITVTTFHVPFGEQFADLLDYIDTYVVPPSKEDPNILHFRVATHAWGDASKNVWFITEYPDLGAIDASNDWQSEWFDEHYPEGTPEREAADAAFEEHFAPYFKHKDNILGVNMNRAK
ncbi:MAG: hypothetical protein ACE5JR_10965 [Gemmatimonadota bacterium]